MGSRKQRIQCSIIPKKRTKSSAKKSNLGGLEQKNGRQVKCAGNGLFILRIIPALLRSIAIY